MPVDEVKPGMRGTGISVFAGETRSEFQVEILGILPNAVGPRRHLILARLSGQRLAETGVMQGMSGSPVYIDGRLIGAVSYSLGRLLEGADRRHHADRRHDRRHRPHHRHPGAGAERRRRTCPGRPRRRSSRRRCATPSRGSPARARRSRWPAPTRRCSPRCRTIRSCGRSRSPTRWPASPATPPRRSPARSARRSRPADAHPGADRRRHRRRGGAGAGRRGRRQPDPRRSRPSARPARSRTSTAPASTRSAIRSSTSGRPTSR